MIAVTACALYAQTPAGGAAQAGGRGAAATAPMILTIPGFPDGGHIDVRFSQAAPGVAPGGGTSPGMSWANAPVGDAEFRPERARHGYGAEPDDGRSGALGGLEYSGHRDRFTRGCAQWLAAGGRQQPMGASAPVRGPGAGANGPFHHYVFDLYALDIKLDVKPSGDAFTTRADVLKAIQGHILAKAVYWGLFRRPQ